MANEDFKLKLESLHKYVTDNPDAELKMVDETGEYIIAIFDTAYESDNGLDPQEEGYEEYNAIAFCEKTTGELFELAYFNLLAEIWHNNNRII